MPKEPETGRFRIYTPHTHRIWNTPDELTVLWKSIGKEYTTRQKAVAEMNRRFKKGDAKVKKVPDLKPLTEKQKSVMAYLKHVGYDSCYSTLINSQYSIPENRNNFMGGTGPLQPLKKRGLIQFKVGINPHRGGKRTCMVVAVPWIIKYHDRFDNWPSMELIKAMEKENDKNKPSSN